MACNNQILVGYTIGIKPVAIIPPFSVTSAGTENGKDFYVWEDPWSLIMLKMFWVESYWAIATVDNPTELLLFLPQPENDCPGLVGEENDWQITEAGFNFQLVSFTSILEEAPVPPSPNCTSWENGTNENLPIPWNAYTFILPDFPNPESLYPGQPISELYFSNPPAQGGTGEYKVGTLVYLLGTTVYNSYVVGSEFIGVLIIDSAGTIIIPSSIVLNSGYVCFIEKENTDNIDNYNKCLVDAQCEFAKCTLKYLQMLQFGAINSGSCKELEILKNKKRTLEILNCYDPRDIENNTTEYNNISYSEIKKLLNL
jgi:hypothetical protein